MVLFAKNELKILWPFYFEKIIGYVLAIAPIFFIPYLLQLEFSMTKIGILLAIMPLTMFIFEIPTGAIADIYGRKFSVLTGYFFEGILYTSIMFSKSFYSLAIIFALLGISATLSSGSKDAWVVDLIKGKRKKFIHNYFVKERSIKGFALIISGIIGAFIVKNFGLTLVWPTTGIGFFASILALAFGEELHTRTKESESFSKIKKQIKKSYSYTRKHSMLFYFLLATFIIAIAGAFNQGMSWIPLLKELNFPDYAFGYMWSLMWGVTAISPLFAKKMMGKSSERDFIIKMTSIGSLLFLLIYFAKTWAIALGIMLLGEFFFEIKYPARSVYFHRHIPKKMRATIGSFEAMLLSLSGIISLPIVGYFIDTFGPKCAIMFSSILAIPGIYLYSKIKQ